mmetsp:Transcript_30698/g.57476  ORF Transcript_30698/g.57476 Transcript_30698/m.57476 type:complete len:241 (+) Transcript_30698:169-891(+)
MTAEVANVTYPCILRSVTWPASKACTAPEQVPASQVSDILHDTQDAKSCQDCQVNTPSTICPTPRTPASLQPLTLPPAVDIPETQPSGSVQPFWCALLEGDEGVLSSPFDEPLLEKVDASSSGLMNPLPIAFGCLGLPHSVYDSTRSRPDDFSPSPRSRRSRSSTPSSRASSPALSAFETPAPQPRSPATRARVSWADLAEEEEMEDLTEPGPKSSKTKARVSWADLVEDSDEEASWQWK